MAGYQLPSDIVAKLSNQERALRDVLADVDKLEACDVDCEEMRLGIKETIARMEKIRANFGSRVNV